ncbi:bifunctional aminodeoxychorismate synthase component I/aminodeoxychorismate lyase [Aeromicrobium camelliae]|uniref:Bifunctional aminodeoxychorismate synthase component I/aminodeoxychorismate lyase n=1 Tax=Aeromicrobium camelliae TaxID=1538144 RepID=A0A3N6WN09_9ACTN|nr:chorismate-binding protein [Aeromicrobium camelliae]RQN08946.1 bifunctional aminodeoxychorismate synthase component I/aminodeoxychorismate lyase [Aeromicrobium camelliae]
MAVGREPIALDASPTDVLRALRDRSRLVALIGSGWSVGEAVIACEPVRELATWDAVDLPRDADPEGFGGGWIGSWGYQLAGEVEALPPVPSRPIPTPALRVGFYDVVLRRVDGQWWLEWLHDADPARVTALRDAVTGDAAARPFTAGPLALTPSPEEHRRAVARTIDHINAGDVFQVNVCARLEGAFHGDPLDAFCSGVEQLAPAFAAYVADDHGAVASWSPELFLRRQGDTVLTSPIKGTAPLDADPAQLLASRKDRAENVMIVDLMRNDLGRVAEPGSVAVPALTRLERHAVWHLVSDVAAQVRAPDSALLRATFPPGSVTGAPKVRAMELVATELETTAREAYTGAIGYVSAAGLELNVAIRTLEFVGDRVWFGVGGGIVADSDPSAELTECFVKARPLARVLGTVLADDVETAAAAPGRRASPGAPAGDPAAGVFTTLLVREGRPEQLDAHVSRLAASAAELYGHDVAVPARALAVERARDLAGTQRLRIEVSPAGRLTATAAPLDTGPASWALVPFPLRGGLGAHKWADRRALPDGPDEPLLLDGDDVLETGRGSVFVVLDDGLHTPPLDGRILPGTMRAIVLERARGHGVPVYERSIRLGELSHASEVFATNALRGIVPVHQVAGVGRWAVPGPVASLLSTPPPPPARVDAIAGADVLFIDNHDSFVFNLVQYARELGARATIVRSDAALPDVSAFSHVVISPGPGGPREAGSSRDAVQAAAAHGVPLLGVCLGHQVIAEVFGARVVRAVEPVHGKPTLVEHRGQGVLAGLPSPFAAARYHSLVVEEPPAELEVTARTGSGIVMGLRHRELPIEGVQFHPESILTRHGHALLGRFLAAR